VPGNEVAVAAAAKETAVLGSLTSDWTLCKRLGELSGYSDELRAGWPWFEYRYCQNFSPLYVFLIGTEAYPASYPMDTGG
jgi:hypothetical protein